MSRPTNEARVVVLLQRFPYCYGRHHQRAGTSIGSIIIPNDQDAKISGPVQLWVSILFGNENLEQNSVGCLGVMQTLIGTITDGQDIRKWTLLMIVSLWVKRRRDAATREN